MKSLVFLFGCALSSWVQPLHAPENFFNFVKKYNRTYTGDELKRRQDIFESNMKWAASLGSSYGITPMADLTREEFRSKYTSSFKHATQSENVEVLSVGGDTPASVDWRTRGVVTPVNDQGQCGSCWAFSATEEIESMIAMAGRPLVPLSVQQILSCDNVDQGCNGGDTTTAYQYVQQAGGLCTASALSYGSGGGSVYPPWCEPPPPTSGNITGYRFAVPPCNSGACASQNETALQAATAAYGPISVCLNANDAWQVYSGGLFTAACSSDYNDIDHCVQIVGYATSGATPYWIVRNSWGTDWGIDGYIWIPIGTNKCSIASHSTVVSV